MKEMRTTDGMYSTDELFAMIGLDPLEVSDGRAYPNRVSESNALLIMEMANKCLVEKNKLLEAEKSAAELLATVNELYVKRLAIWNPEEDCPIQ